MRGPLSESDCFSFFLFQLLVRWFGDHTLTQVEPGKLKTLSEGLEAHHKARKKHRK